MDFKKISSLFGKAGTEVKEELSVEEQASLEAAEQKLAEYETEITKLKGQVSVLTEEKSGLEAEVETLKADVAAKQEELDKKPDGQATTVVAKDDEFDDDKPKYHVTSIDRQKAEMNAD